MPCPQEGCHFRVTILPVFSLFIWFSLSVWSSSEGIPVNSHFVTFLLDSFLNDLVLVITFLACGIAALEVNILMKCVCIFWQMTQDCNSLPWCPFLAWICISNCTNTAKNMRLLTKSPVTGCFFWKIQDCVSLTYLLQSEPLYWWDCDTVYVPESYFLTSFLTNAGRLEAFWVWKRADNVHYFRSKLTTTLIYVQIEISQNKANHVVGRCMSLYCLCDFFKLVCGVPQWSTVQF